MAYKNLVLQTMVDLDRPTYGYELRQRLAWVHNLLEITDGGIYAALNNLERTRLIRVVDGDTEASRRRWVQRKKYEVTAKGKAHQQEWKGAPAPRTPLRQGVHMQLLIATDDDIPDLLESLEQFERACQEKIQEVFAAGTPDLPGGARPWAVTCVRNGFVESLQADVEWAQRTAETLRRQHEGTPRAS